MSATRVITGIRFGLLTSACAIALACGGGGEKGGTDKPTGPACSTDLPCASGTVCLDSVCVQGGSLGLSVPAGARGCELLLSDGASAQIVSAQFANGLKGSYVRRAPKTGVSFVADGDHAIEEGAASLIVAGGGEPAMARVSCVDGLGKPLPNASIAFAD